MPEAAPDAEWSTVLEVVWELGFLAVFCEVLGVLQVFGVCGVLGTLAVPEVLGVETCLSGVGCCPLSAPSGSGVAPPSEA